MLVRAPVAVVVVEVDDERWRDDLRRPRERLAHGIVIGVVVRVVGVLVLRARAPGELHLRQHVFERRRRQRAGGGDAGPRADARVARHERGAVPIVLARTGPSARRVRAAGAREIAGALAHDGVAGRCPFEPAHPHQACRPFVRTGACVGDALVGQALTALEIAMQRFLARSVRRALRDADVTAAVRGLAELRGVGRRGRRRCYRHTCRRRPALHSAVPLRNPRSRTDLPWTSRRCRRRCRYGRRAGWCRPFRCRRRCLRRRSCPPSFRRFHSGVASDCRSLSRARSASCTRRAQATPKPPVRPQLHMTSARILPRAIDSQPSMSGARFAIWPVPRVTAFSKTRWLDDESSELDSRVRVPRVNRLLSESRSGSAFSSDFSGFAGFGVERFSLRLEAL